MLLSTTYTVDARGSRTKEVSPGYTADHVYDALGRLTSSTLHTTPAGGFPSDTTRTYSTV